MAFGSSAPQVAPRVGLCGGRGMARKITNKQSTNNRAKTASKKRCKKGRPNDGQKVLLKDAAARRAIPKPDPCRRGRERYKPLPRRKGWIETRYTTLSRAKNYTIFGRFPSGSRWQNGCWLNVQRPFLSMQGAPLCMRSLCALGPPLCVQERILARVRPPGIHPLR